VHGLYKATYFEHGGKRKSRLTAYYVTSLDTLPQKPGGKMKWYRDIVSTVPKTTNTRQDPTVKPSVQTKKRTNESPAPIRKRRRQNDDDIRPTKNDNQLHPKWAEPEQAEPDRVRVVGAHFVTICLALNSTFRLNCQQKFDFCAAGRRKFPSSSTLLDVRYVPSPYCATTITQLWATGGKYWCLRRRKTHLQPNVIDCRPWRLAARFQQQK
jgi:hypothetical protein